MFLFAVCTIEVDQGPKVSFATGTKAGWSSPEIVQRRLLNIYNKSKVITWKETYGTLHNLLPAAQLSQPLYHTPTVWT